MARHQRPHDLRPGESFDPACIYIHDDGRCACGAHVGTEATYQAQAWSCLGLGPSFIHELTTFRCELCRPTAGQAPAKENPMPDTNQTASPTTPISDTTVAAMKGAKHQRTDVAGAKAKQKAKRAAAKGKPAKPAKEKKAGKAAASDDGRVTFAIKVTPELQEAIAKAAQARGESKTAFATRVLEKAVNV